jgi:RNA polymerase sigma-70 factor, ECF subfamily
MRDFSLPETKYTMVSDASERAFKRHYAEIFRFLRRRTASADEAEELAQIVFTEAAARLPTLPATRDSVLGWLYTVARRRLIDHLRRQALRTGTLAELDAARLAAVEEAEYGPHVATAIASALARLPGSQREVVVMALLEGRSFADIARRVGASEGACKMRFARGLETLRDDLAGQGIEP